MQLATDIATANLRHRNLSLGPVYVIVDVDGRQCYRVHGVSHGAILVPELFRAEDELLEALTEKCEIVAEGAAALIVFRNIDTLPYESTMRIRTWRMSKAYPIFVQNSSWEADSLMADLAHRAVAPLSAWEMEAHVRRVHGVTLTAAASTRLCEVVCGCVGYADDYVAHLCESQTRRMDDTLSHLILSGPPAPRDAVVERELNLLSVEALAILKVVASLQTVSISWLVHNFSFDAVDQLCKYRWIATADGGGTSFISEYERLVVVDMTTPAERLDAVERMKDAWWCPALTSGPAVALASTAGVGLDAIVLVRGMERLYADGDFAHVVQIGDQAIEAGLLEESRDSRSRSSLLIVFAAALYATGRIQRAHEVASEVDPACLRRDWVDVHTWLSDAGAMAQHDDRSLPATGGPEAPRTMGGVFCRMADACRAFREGRFDGAAGIAERARSMARGGPYACLLPALAVIGARAEAALGRDSSAVKVISDAFAGLRLADSGVWVIGRLEQITVLISNLYLDVARALLEQTSAEVGRQGRASWSVESEILDDVMCFLCGDVPADVAAVSLRGRRSQVACVQVMRAVVLWLATDGQCREELERIATEPDDDVLASPVSVRLCFGFAAQMRGMTAHPPTPASMYRVPPPADETEQHLSGSALLACAMSSGYGAQKAEGASRMLVKEVARAGSFAVGSPSDGCTYRKTVLSRVLSERQVEVVMLAASGLSNAEVARELHISTRTAENLLYRSYRVLHVHGREDIVSSLSF